MSCATSFLKFLILPAGLLITGTSHANQQASAQFMVSVKLQSSVKAMDPVQLCQRVGPLSLVAASGVRIDCPTGMNAKTASGLNTGTANPGISPTPSEILVTY